MPENVYVPKASALLVLALPPLQIGCYLDPNSRESMKLYPKTHFPLFPLEPLDLKGPLPRPPFGGFVTEEPLISGP